MKDQPENNMPDVIYVPEMCADMQCGGMKIGTAYTKGTDTATMYIRADAEILRLVREMVEARKLAYPGEWFSGFHSNEASVYKDEKRNYANRICDFPTWGANAPDDEGCQSSKGAENNAAFCATAANHVSKIASLMGDK